MGMWKKFSVVAAALVTAGCSCTPEEQRSYAPASEAPDPNAAIAEGFYKVATADAVVYVKTDGKLRPILTAEQNECVRVLDGSKGFGTARVRFDGHDDAYIGKEDLTPAPECDTRTGVKPEGFTLASRAIFIYPSPESADSIAQLTKGQCVTVLGARPSEDWTRVVAETPRGRIEGWGYQMHIDLMAPCTP